MPASSKLAALHLHFAGEESRLRVDPAFWLQIHDFLGDLLRVLRFMRADLGFAEREERFRFRGRIGRARENFVSAVSASLG